MNAVATQSLVDILTNRIVDADDLLGPAVPDVG